MSMDGGSTEALHRGSPKEYKMCAEMAGAACADSLDAQGGPQAGHPCCAAPQRRV